MTPSKPIPASIVIPTRSRAAYLEVALSSIAPQAGAAGAEVLVIDDAGPSPEGLAQAERFGARYEPLARPRGLNVARNTGVQRSGGELVVFVDDDVQAGPGWLQALLTAAREHPDVDVFAGPIRPRLEGRSGWGSHSCGREGAPITTLDLGGSDVEARYAWGANMAIRREALERVGAFEESLEHGGDEQEWQDRLRARDPGARVLYVAGAGVDHRRAGPDAQLRGLARAQYTRGRAARRFDARRGQAPSPRRELATLAGCMWHVARRGCPAGLTMVAHSAGRVSEAVRERAGSGDVLSWSATRAGAGAAGNGATPGGNHAAGGGASPSPSPSGGGTDDFLSGQSGTVGGMGGILRDMRDHVADAWEIASARRLRLDLAARHEPPLRRVLAIGVVRPERAALAQSIRAELLRSRHEVELRTCPPGGLGKFENLNRLLAERVGGSPIQERDWLLVIDDDVELPRGFLDRLLFLCERFELQLAQPAHRSSSHAAWSVTRRRPASVVRETEFVEIGPVTAFSQATFATLLPFPELRMGWGLDAHWAALAREHGWRCGVIDAVAIGHRVAPAADAYSREAAIAEAREFLARRPYLRAAEMQRTLTTHRRW
ncbi:MAG TPA: glycosyltransferase family 2 protein [Solirubrobacteraceae bacterium]|nr:glycosyltransferase family 2 protein [Solirubrobacteraceae bacterium]